jgi:hypothetical protein
MAIGRTCAKANMRPIIKSDFDFRSPAMTASDVKHNRRIYQSIRVNNFHLMVSTIFRQTYSLLHH